MLRNTHVATTTASAPTDGSAARRRGGPAGRIQPYAHLSTAELLAQHAAGKASPLRVLDLILSRYNHLHTALEKTVSHKTRHERAQFLRRFFRDLKSKAGYGRIPDPRNLAQKHVRVMLGVWCREALAPSTIQTYLSFLRGLALWVRKPGLVREPAYYGVSAEQSERHEYAQRDKTWSGNGVDPDALLAKVSAYDERAATCLGLMRHLGLRKKESLLLKPYLDVATASEAGMGAGVEPTDRFVRIVGKGGRPRWVALNSAARQAAIGQAQRMVATHGDHMGDPALDLKRNLRRLEYVMEKFGITLRDLGVTGHGLRHEMLNECYEQQTGWPSPVRGGVPGDSEKDKTARLEVARLAGHNRLRSSGAYLGQSAVMRRKGRNAPLPQEPDDSVCA